MIDPCRKGASLVLSWLRRVALMALLAGGATGVMAMTDLPVQALSTFTAHVASEWGPFYSEDVTLSGEMRTRGLGPFVETQDVTNAMSFTAIRPFFSRVEDEQSQRVLKEYLWPFAMLRDLEEDRFWRVLIAYGHDFDTGEASRYRATVFPLYTMGRTEDGEEYWGLFPFWGDVREVLTYDRIRFALFPLFLEMWKQDRHSVSWLWPIFSRTQGDMMSAMRVFPFYGRAEHADGRHRRFVMWPFWTQMFSNRSGEGEDGFILWPIYGRVRHSNGSTRWILPPLFKFHYKGDETDILAPWPFIRYTDGSTKRLQVWPLWGRKEVGPVASRYYLWPIVRFQDVSRTKTVMRSRFVLPVYYYQDEIARESDETLRKYVKLWPLASYQREGEVSRLRALELWPLKRTGAIERNLAPFWTLFTHSTAGPNRETELFWGLFRKRVSADGAHSISLFPFFEHDHSHTAGRSWSILKGLIGVDDNSLKREIRLLYFFRLGGSGESDPEALGDDPAAGD